MVWARGAVAPSEPGGHERLPGADMRGAWMPSSRSRRALIAACSSRVWLLDRYQLGRSGDEAGTGVVQVVNEHWPPKIDHGGDEPDPRHDDGAPKDAAPPMLYGFTTNPMRLHPIPHAADVSIGYSRSQSASSGRTASMVNVSPSRAARTRPRALSGLSDESRADCRSARRFDSVIALPETSK